MSSMTRLLSLPLLAVGLTLGTASLAAPIKLIDADTPGYYNDALGSLLHNSSAAFSASKGDEIRLLSPPDLSSAQTQLGNWLNHPEQLPNNLWSAQPVAIPPSWAANTQTAVIYPLSIPRGGYRDLQFELSTDNGAFIWVDGKYQFGAVGDGTKKPEEFRFTLPYLTQGRHYVQVLRTDHGGNAPSHLKVTAHNDALINVEHAWIEQAIVASGETITIHARLSGDPLTIGRVIFQTETGRTLLSDINHDGTWSGTYRVQDKQGFNRISIRVEDKGGKALAQWPSLLVK